jgi:membrane fusion protein (multidrug efflux system)
MPHVFIIGEGLEEDDKVLIEGLRRVQDGQEIALNFQPPEEVFSKLDLYAE